MIISVLIIIFVLIASVESGPDSDPVTDTVVTLKAVSDSTAVLFETADRVRISIERVKVSCFLEDTLDIILASSGISLAGFDFKIASDSPFLDIMEIIPGEIYDSCGWEFFDARPVRLAGIEGEPEVLWQAVALAETIPDDTRPACYSFDRPASLLRLVVSSAHIDQVPDTTVSIFFYWEDCTDNTMSSKSGDTLAISVQVVDYFNPATVPSQHSFPTRIGAPKQCIDPGVRNKPLRLIEFYNGGVEFFTEVELDSE